MPSELQPDMTTKTTAKRHFIHRLSRIITELPSAIIIPYTLSMIVSL